MDAATKQYKVTGWNTLKIDWTGIKVVTLNVHGKSVTEALDTMVLWSKAANEVAEGSEIPQINFVSCKGYVRCIN